ncbi:MAG: hypothetical protein NTZ63_06820 [Candidatus Omnitrophica bacterium]|nr:hypothetical protein [Candidatus Omnitrophota bacterium]
MDERINPSPVEQIPTGYNLDLIADYSPVKSIDNNIEPASNLIIDPDPAKAAQYEANVFSQETTKLYQQKTSSAPEDSTNYKLDANGNLLFERIKKTVKPPAQLKIKTKNYHKLI